MAERVPRQVEKPLLEAILSHLESAKRPDGMGAYTALCPFHPDGEGQPPHQPNLRVFEKGFVCHACKEKGSLKKLAEKLGIERFRGRRIEATYDYCDAAGGIRYQVVRKSGKKFSQRRPNGEGGWIWNLDGVEPLLYQLPKLLANRDEVVYIVEGEKDADRLASLGLLATTNSGGAGKWRKEFAEFLRGLRVVVIPDNDTAGRKHVDDVVRSLVGIAGSLKLLELPNLPEKGDTSNWLELGHTKEELLQLVELASEISNDDILPSNSPKNMEEGSRSESLTKQIVELVLASGIELFHDEREEPYARVNTRKGKRIFQITSRAFRRVLSSVAWNELGKAPGGEVLNSAALTLGSIACLNHDQHRLWVRHASHEGELWVDLDGCRAVRITSQGWSIVEEPPILFRTFAHQRPLPEPTRGGDPWQIFDFLNVPDDALTLMKGFLVASFVPNVPVAGLALHGVQGSTKSTLFRVLKRTLDPSNPELRRGIKDPTELAQVLFQNRVVLFDNLTSLPDWLSDALCGAITGDGWSKRALYTDEDSIFFEYQRVIGIGGINLVIDKADLLDRCVLLELQPIPRTQKRQEAEFWNAFEDALPDILGGLLGIVSKAMAEMPFLDLVELPRMADFCRWGAATATAEGKGAAIFLHAYDRNISHQSDAALDASPVGGALTFFMEDHAEWSGSPGELLENLTGAAEILHIDTRTKSWPKAANWLSHRLKEIQPSLEARGIRVNSERTGGRRIIRVQRVSENCVTTVTAVREPTQAGVARDLRDAMPSVASAHCVTDSVTRKVPVGMSRRAHDANDGNDAIFGTTSRGLHSGEDDEPALHEDFEERAAIIEFEGGLGRRLAEERAKRLSGTGGHA